MVVTEAAQKIKQLERDVTWRMRLLALQDRLAPALLVGGLVAAGAVLYIRLRPAHFPVWAAVLTISALVAAIALGRWYPKRATALDAAFLIDKALDLEDRISSAHEVIEKGVIEKGEIERGAPVRVVETALVEDAAERIVDARASKIAPHRFKLSHALSLIGVIALLLAVMIPERSLPGGEAIATERADIQTAGEQLEQAAEEVKQIVPPGTETEKLAKEQVELGRALRRSTDTRAEALKKLSALEERIRSRHDELANTRADEIVALAEKRLGSALSSQPESSSVKATKKNDESRGSQESDSSSAPAEEAKPAPPGPPKSGAASTKRTAESDPKRVEKPEPTPEKESSEPEKADAGPHPDADKTPEQNQGKPEATDSGTKTTEEKATATGQAKSEGGKTPEVNVDAVKNIPGAVAEQAAKALPGMSEQLLKKAEQFRADQLKPEDIKQIAQAAQLLARDLAPIMQSKEFQQAVEQLARQVTPEQMERVARELKKNEELRKELEAAGRLLMQNQQAKEMAAGLAKELGEMRARNDQLSPGNLKKQSGQTESGQTEGRQTEGRQTESRQTEGETPPGASVNDSLQGPGRDSKMNQSGRQGKSRGRGERVNQENRLTGEGRESALGGRLQSNPGGEYLYLEAKPGSGAARVPYTSAYPQYRREAERTVERSQIPPRFRSVVRNYFDSINPDGHKEH